MVLRSLSAGITPELADGIDEYRRKDDSVLSNTTWFLDMAGVTGEQKQKLSNLITFKSNYFKIISVGKMNNMTKTISGVVQRTDLKSVKIIKWRQD
jgi:type II secretory pathway component PulK